MQRVLNRKPASYLYWVLAFFLLVVFLTGGSARVDAQSLPVLRPLSIIMCAVALLTLRRDHLVRRKWLVAGFAAVILLCVAHLIPLPPGIWQSLPGRTVLVDVDRIAGLGEIWRPLSITPMNGWHALASLATPLAVLLLGMQLEKDDLHRLLPLLLGLASLSGLLGVLQVIGDSRGPLYLYRITNHGSAVGLFANRNHAAVLLACVFPLCAVFASIASGTSDEQRVRQVGAMAACIVTVPLILITGSRSGLAIGFLALIGGAFLYRKPVEGRTVRRAKTGIKFEAWQILSAVVLLAIALTTIVFSRAEALRRLFSQPLSDDLRVSYWPAGVEMVWRYFPAGSGIGSFVEAFQIDESLGLLRESYANHMHNDWLEIVATGGLPAAAILFVATIAYLRVTWILWRYRGREAGEVQLARLSSVLIAIVGLASVTDYPLRTPIWLALFAVFCLWLTENALASTRATPSRAEALP